MAKEKLKTNTHYLKKNFLKFFSPVRWTVYLIILPAFFVVNIYFLNILTEFAIGEKLSPTIGYELRLAPLRKDLPAHGYVNYISDQKEEDDYIVARYALIPARVIKGLKPKTDYLVVQYLETDKIPSFEEYTLYRDYGNGVMLFKRVFN
jgi:hypothetical protein